MIKVSKLCLLLPFLFFHFAHAQDTSGNYHLGNGLVVFDGLHYNLIWEKKIPLYQDSTCKSLWFNLAATDTRCPTCMACAEPVDYYTGKYRPFRCGDGEGLAFICTRATRDFREIILDTSGTRAFLNNRTGVYYSWKNYLLRQARKGDYFRIERQWDSTVLYDKPYDPDNLPKAGPYLTVGTKFTEIDFWRFYPVDVKGYWVKLKATDGGQFKGYCWIMWRDEKTILNWFAWRAE